MLPAHCRFLVNSESQCLAFTTSKRKGSNSMMGENTVGHILHLSTDMSLFAWF